MKLDFNAMKVSDRSNKFIFIILKLFILELHLVNFYCFLKIIVVVVLVFKIFILLCLLLLVLLMLTFLWIILVMTKLNFTAFYGESFGTM